MPPKSLLKRPSPNHGLSLCELYTKPQGTDARPMSTGAALVRPRMKRGGPRRLWEPWGGHSEPWWDHVIRTQHRLRSFSILRTGATATQETSLDNRGWIRAVDRDQKGWTRNPARSPSFPTEQICGSPTSILMA